MKIFTRDVDVERQNRINPLETSKEVMFCSAGKSSYWLTWDGKMIPCVLMNSPFTNPFESNFLDSWEKIKNKVNEITDPDDCKNCEYKSYCDSCPGKLQAETGYFNKTSLYICELAKTTKKYIIGE